MGTIKQLVVSIFLEDEKVEVGELVSERGTVYFKYYPKFMERGIEISPFKMKLSTDILTPDTDVFEGLFGVFNDSLPDGWGKLLLDRYLVSKGVLLSQISPLDRLAYLGNQPMGALDFSPKKEANKPIDTALDLNRIQQEINVVMEGSSSQLLDELYQIGGSSGGARPKIGVGYHPAQDKLWIGNEKLPEGYEHWIIKFPSSTDFVDIANIEYAYYKMAIDCGIEMMESKLFEDSTGKPYFGTMRFDRIGNQRLHIHSVSGMLHDNFRYSNLDYGNIMDCAFTLEKQVEAYKKVLRLAAFNVFSHNRDDHSKNFSFLMTATGEWRFAPAYDLTFSFSAHGMHSTLVAGEGRSPGKKHLLELATVFGVENAEEIINDVQIVIANWAEYAKDCGVTHSSMKLIEKELKRLV